MFLLPNSSQIRKEILASEIPTQQQHLPMIVGVFWIQRDYGYKDEAI